MYTCYPRIWLALTPTSIPPSPSPITNENFDASRARELPCKWHPLGLCCVFHQAEEPPCSDDLCPPPPPPPPIPPSPLGYNPWIIARGAAYSTPFTTATSSFPSSTATVMSRAGVLRNWEKKGEEKNSGKKLACRVTRERRWDNDGVAAINYH